VLEQDFLIPMGITPYRLAKETGIPQTRISEIIKGKRGITCNTALKLAKFFGTSPDLWIGLQKDYDMEEELKQISEELDKIKPYTRSS
ncbi:MAG TPA: HigA family addiction module antitoxin, partial [Negativicutes bacterium]|nr:HigA family addiction module antitoxin [Negativicutes bacterium]